MRVYLHNQLLHRARETSRSALARSLCFAHEGTMQVPSSLAAVGLESCTGTNVPISSLGTASIPVMEAADAMAKEKSIDFLFFT